MAEITVFCYPDFSHSGNFRRINQPFFIKCRNIFNGNGPDQRGGQNYIFTRPDEIPRIAFQIDRVQDFLDPAVRSFQDFQKFPGINRSGLGDLFDEFSSHDRQFGNGQQT